MCRWAAYCGEPLFLEDIVSSPAHSLIAQSHSAVEARTGADSVMVRAARADVLVVLQVGLVEHGLATRALDPEAFGHLAALARVGRCDFWGKKFF